MKAKKDPAHRRGEATKHWVNAYLMQLICITALLLSAGGVLDVSFIHEDTADVFLRLLVCFLPCAVLMVFCVIHSYGILRRVTITRDRLVLKAPLRRTLVYRLSDIRHVRIDDSTLSVSRQYWVVMGQEPIPSRYVHRISTLPITPRCLRMRYTPSLDTRLTGLLTGEMYRRWSRAQAAVRTGGFGQPY